MTSLAIQESTLSIKGFKSKSKITISSKKLHNASMILRAINHGLRQDIIKLIEKNGKMTVTEIYAKLKLEQSVASQQLAILRNAGILITERDGKYIHYTINFQRIENIHTFVEDIVNY